MSEWNVIRENFHTKHSVLTAPDEHMPYIIQLHIMSIRWAYYEKWSSRTSNQFIWLVSGGKTSSWTTSASTVRRCDLSLPIAFCHTPQGRSPFTLLTARQKGDLALHWLVFRAFKKQTKLFFPFLCHSLSFQAHERFQRRVFIRTNFYYVSPFGLAVRR